MTATQRAASTQLLTVAETAQRLRCCRNTVYAFIARGELACLDIGTGKAKTRIPESVLEQFIADRLRRAG